MKAVLLLSFIGVVFRPTGAPPGPPVPPPTCGSPNPLSVEKLKDAGLKGRYPSVEIRTAMQSTPEIRNGFSAARRDICDCYKGRPKPSSAAGDKNIATAVCPVTYEVFTFPKSEMFDGKKCWILRPWVGLNCPYRGCRFRSCRGVKATVGTQLPICRPTNYKCKVYYIWCPDVKRFYRRRKCLPQCCSCIRCIK